MKDTLKYLGILVAVLVAVIIFNQSTRVNGRTAFEVLLSKIPGLNNWVEQDYDSNVYSLKQLDMTELRTAYYNVDFLMSINKSGEQYVAIYPYVVEAGYELNNANETAKDTVTSIVFPATKIKVKNNDKRGITVIRSADIPSEYKTMLETAFRNRAIDLAFENGIINDAQKNCNKFFEGLFPDKKIVIDYTPTKDSRVVEQSNKTPVKFVYCPDALKSVGVFTTRHRKIQTDSAKVYFNPEDMFLKVQADKGLGIIARSVTEKEIALYYNLKCQKEIDELNREVANKSRKYKDINAYYWIKYYDPLTPKRNKIRAELWNVSDGHNHIGFSVGNHQYCFNVKVGDFSGYEYFNVCSDLFYLAMSAKNSGITNTLYNEYLECYDDVVHNVNNGQITHAISGFKNLCEIKAENNDEALNYSEQNLKAYIDLKGKGEPNFIGYEPLDILLKAAQVFSNNNPDTMMTPEFQKNFLLNYPEMNIDTSDVYRILELFCTLPQTTDKAKDEYYQMLQKSGYYSPAIVANSSAKDYCDYMFNMLHKYDKYNQFIEQQGGRTQNQIIIVNKDNADIDKYKRDEINDFLEKNSMSNENGGQVVLCLPVDTTLWLYKKYPLIVFEKNKVSVVSDCSFNTVYSTELKNVKPKKKGNDYLIFVDGYEQVVPISLYEMVQEIYDREDNVDRSKEWLQKISTALRHKINNYCNRPEPML